MKKKAEEIFLAGVESVLPEKLIQTRIKRSGDVLQIAGKSYPLSRFKHIYVLAAGKAAALMAKETERILGNKITGGHVVTKYGHETNLKYLKLTEAGHPIPDAEGVKGTREMLDIARQSGEEDLVICLISDGASALMTDLPEGTTLDDLRHANELLVKCGADITEINTVRKHLSNVKGGQLAKTLYPATTICLILSDVTGDKLEVIASGPTVADPSTFSDALAVVEKYSLKDSLPTPMLHYLLGGVNGSIPETPKPGNPVFQNVSNYIVGSNRVALENAANKAREMGWAGTSRWSYYHRKHTDKCNGYGSSHSRTRRNIEITSIGIFGSYFSRFRHLFLRELREYLCIKFISLPNYSSELFC